MDAKALEMIVARKLTIDLSTLEDGGITSSKLTLNASVPGLDQAKFDELVDHAEHNCPISKLFKTEISVNATLA